MPKSKGETRRRAQVESDGNYLRSRTISGYDPTEDYREQAEELERSKEAKKESRKKQRHIVTGCLLALLALAVFAFSQATIVLMGVEYNDSTISRDQDEAYLALAGQYLVQHPSERFSWALRNETMAEFLQVAYPEVGAVEVRGNFGLGKLHVTIRQPVAVWKTAEAKHYVDASGAVFGRNFYGDPSITISDQSNSGIVSQRFLAFIGKVISGVEGAGVGSVNRVNIPAGAIRFVEITLENRGHPIKIQTDRNPDSQVADVVNMVKFLDDRGITPQYVDVRVKNRGFWK